MSSIHACWSHSIAFVLKHKQLFIDNLAVTQNQYLAHIHLKLVTWYNWKQQHLIYKAKRDSMSDQEDEQWAFDKRKKNKNIT